MNRIISGVTPSGYGSLHIGNYFGSIKQQIELQAEGEAFFFVSDLHALTTIQDKQKLTSNIENLILNYLSLGIDPNKCTFFRQSDVSYHTDFEWILANVTPLGEIKRMHAFKDKLQKGVSADDISLGLFSYPVLMAADILIYKANIVPVGEDQRQHIEITKDIAKIFNKRFGEILVIPEAKISKENGVIKGTDGQRKMSKSIGNIIGIFDSEEIITKQIMSTVTDTTRIKPTDPGHIENNVIFTYHDLLNDDKDLVKDLKQRYIEGKVGDVEVKKLLIEAHLRYFKNARNRRKELENNPPLVKDILEKGAQNARSNASITINQVREAVGLVTKYN